MTVTELRKALEKLEAEGHGALEVHCEDPIIVPAKPRYCVFRSGFVSATEEGYARNIRTGEIVPISEATELRDIPAYVSVE